MSLVDANVALRRAVELSKPGAPYELRPIYIDGVQCLAYARAPKSIPDIYRRATSMGGATLITYGHRRLTYNEARTLCQRLAKLLELRCAISPGCRVGLLIDDALDWVIAFMAITSVGATAVLFDPNSTVHFRHCINVSRCTVLIASASLAAATAVYEAGRQVILINNMVIRFRGETILHNLRDSVAGLGTAALTTISLASHQEALVSFTSGSTGLPKGVVSTHLGVITGLMNMIFAAALSSAENKPARRPEEAARRRRTTLVLSPFSHISGYGQLLLALFVGGTLAVLPHWDPHEAMSVITDEKVGYIAGLSYIQLEELSKLNFDGESLSGIGISGVALHTGILDEIGTRWPHVSVGVGYGMTETNGSIASTAGIALRQRPFSSGVVVPTMEVRVANRDGRAQSDGGIGEIWLRGASLMLGYCSPTGAMTGIDHGWFRTGDVGKVVGGRELYVIDRICEVLTVHGATIYPTMIERILLADPAVFDTAVLRVADTTVGQGFVAFVVVRPGFSITQEKLRCMIIDEVAAAQDFVRIVILDKLPRGTSGKLDRMALRDRLT